jgi:protein phosphatase
MTTHPIVLAPNALVLLLAPSGAGKSTFAATHFRETEVVSSDRCRALVSDDESDQKCSSLAFEVFHKIIDARLSLGRLTVADATNINPSARLKLKELARQNLAPVYVIAFDTSLAICLKQNKQRTRYVPPDAIRSQHERFLVAFDAVQFEGYEKVYTVREDQKVEILVSGGNTVAETGWDIIGDVHGCFTELHLLIEKLGYRIYSDIGFPFRAKHPEGRRLAFVGDLTDRGPYNYSALSAVRSLVEAGDAVAVMGNHDNKLWRALKGNKIRVGHGLAATLAELEMIPNTDRYRDFLGSLPYQLRLSVPGVRDDVVISHAGIPRPMVGRTDKTAQAHCIYGDVKGQGEDGFPIRSEAWTSTWPNEPGVPWQVHGHIVNEYPFGNTNEKVVNVDTGCVFGGKLTAFLYPECRLVSVDARKVYHVREQSGE